MPTGERICVVIGRTRHKMVQIEIQEAAKRGARLIELRLDFLAKAPDYHRLLDKKPCALMATLRRPSDGGRFSGTEDERKMLLRQAIVAGFDWVDLETDIADEIRRFKEVRRVISYHNMRETPDDLEGIHEQMCHQDPDVVKIAVRAQRIEDNLRVLALLKKPAAPTIAFCMGDLGMPSRIIGAKMGVPFTYGGFNKERSLAPGLPTFDELKNVYRFADIGRETAVYGVVGDPIGHSLSPLIHNTAFRSLGINSVYVPMRVPRGELPSFLDKFGVVPIQGLSVTIPHKETAATLAETKDFAVQVTQAANTLVLEKQGFAAYNTDYSAAVSSLLHHMPKLLDGSPPTLHSRTILLLGAGGVARAIGHAMHREGALVTIANRTIERAQRLASEVGCRYIDWEARHSLANEIVINATSVGMTPNLDEMPIHPSYLKPGLVVFDAVYTPENTLLIKESRNRGCLTITGVDMFIRQAALQFRLFTGHEPPLDVMEKVVRHALSPVALKPADE